VIPLVDPSIRSEKTLYWGLRGLGREK